MVPSGRAARRPLRPSAAVLASWFPGAVARDPAFRGYPVAGTDGT
ncbi:hypothetical protein ACFQ60_39720 [Streptomyces zhihengii]